MPVPIQADLRLPYKTPSQSFAEGVSRTLQAIPNGHAAAEAAQQLGVESARHGLNFLHNMPGKAPAQKPGPKEDEEEILNRKSLMYQNRGSRPA